MSNRWEQSLRNQRKLPSIPPTRRQAAHRSAVDWFQARHQIVGTALTIADMHPKLTPTQACDKLCNLVSNTSFANRMEAADRSHGGEKQNINIKVPIAPTFSVSRVPESGPRPADYAYVNKLYMCGNIAEEKWAKLVLSLSRTYFVRCMPEHFKDTSEIWGPILQSDVFIFLMDNHSLRSKDCLDQLETAIELNVKVVFIREASLRRPSPLARPNLSTYKQNDKNYYGISKGDELITQRPNSSREDGHTTGRNGLYVHDSHLSVMTGKLQPGTVRPCSSSVVPSCRSAPDLHNIGNHVITPDPDTPRPLFGSNAFIASPPVQHIDLTKVIQDGYNNAVIYESNRHREVAMLLRSMLNKSQNGFEKPSKIFLPTPPPASGDQSRETSPYEDMDTQATPEPETVKDTISEDDSEIDSSCQDTVYLICTNENKTESPLKVFHWPSDCTHDSITNSPSIDSFGFEDIDLSKSLNNLDLSGYLSD